jgi:hypothetical protein
MRPLGDSGFPRLCVPDKVDDAGKLLLADLAGTELPAIQRRRIIMNPDHAPALASRADP